jgi:DNA-binding MarR family transcriptional regulator
VKKTTQRPPHASPERRLGKEAGAGQDDHLAVRTWLRMLSCSTQIEQEIRARLRREFATTLPRFDYLAQLQRHPEGLRMKVLSEFMMVSGGNVTGLTEQLVADGWVSRQTDPRDARSSIVSLTARGRREFLRMAARHEQWLMSLFAGFGTPRKLALYDLLGDLRHHLADK